MLNTVSSPLYHCNHQASDSSKQSTTTPITTTSASLSTIAKDTSSNNNNNNNNNNNSSKGKSLFPHVPQEKNSPGTELSATWQTSVTADVPLNALEPSLRLLQSAAWGLLRYLLCASVQCNTSTTAVATAAAVTRNDTATALFARGHTSLQTTGSSNSSSSSSSSSAGLQRDLFDVLLLELRLGAVCMEQLHTHHCASDSEVSHVSYFDLLSIVLATKLISMPLRTSGL
jgi:hypothetical protein